MDFELEIATTDDVEQLVQLRISAMKESLTNVGRFDPERVRNRFLDSFSPADTQKIIVDDSTNRILVGFFTLFQKPDHLHLHHLYIHPDFQNAKLGGEILNGIKQKAATEQLPLRLQALRDSRSNEFYLKHGFTKTHEKEWDIHYKFCAYQ